MHNSQTISAPKLSNSQIDQLADQLYQTYTERVGKDIARAGVQFDSFYRAVVKPDYQIGIVEGCDLGVDGIGVSLLGKYNPIRNTAYIDKKLSRGNGDRRRVFTLWHEVCGHGILHGDYIRQCLSSISSDYWFDVTQMSIDPTSTNIFERQANRLAAGLAAPTRLVMSKVFEHFRLTRHRPTIRFIGPGEYTLTPGGISQTYRISSYMQMCQIVAQSIRPYFGELSVEALGYRVAACPLIQNASQAKFIGHYNDSEISGLELNRVAV